MTTPTPATLDITISRQTGFLQDLLLRCADSPQHLLGYRFAAQLWSVDGALKYLDLAIPMVVTPGGIIRLLLTQAVAEGIVTVDEAITGGDAAETGGAPELSGGDAAAAYAPEPLSGGRAWMGVLPELSRWDLLQRNPGGRLQLLLRGTATLED